MINKKIWKYFPWSKDEIRIICHWIHCNILISRAAINSWNFYFCQKKVSPKSSLMCPATVMKTFRQSWGVAQFGCAYNPFFSLKRFWSAVVGLNKCYFNSSIPSWNLWLLAGLCSRRWIRRQKWSRRGWDPSFRIFVARAVWNHYSPQCSLPSTHG